MLQSVSELLGWQITGKTLGILGMGHIGSLLEHVVYHREPPVLRVRARLPGFAEIEHLSSQSQVEGAEVLYEKRSAVLIRAWRMPTSFASGRVR